MQKMFCSQLSCVKLCARQLMLQIEVLPGKIEQLILDFIKPWSQQSQLGEISIELLIGNEIPSKICADWDIYEQILFHIIQNAFKFSKKGGTIKLTLSYHPVDLVTNRRHNIADSLDDADNFGKFGFLVTEVEDFGSGIDKKDMADLFSMFNAEKADVLKTSGIGLGLTTAKSLS